MAVFTCHIWGIAISEEFMDRIYPLAYLVDIDRLSRNRNNIFERSSLHQLRAGFAFTAWRRLLRVPLFGVLTLCGAPRSLGSIIR